ncbi:hypothetical protein BGZ75_005829 [Mortierella antarctica]|nr:hypothetical protein BGZ75_005829 [Mortierella antarctica]
MTVPADALHSNTSPGKLRPLTTVPAPMLPTEHHLRASAQHQPSAQRPKSSLLSSWLSSNASGSGAKPGADSGSDGSRAPQGDRAAERHADFAEDRVHAYAHTNPPPLHTNNRVHMNEYSAPDQGARAESMGLDQRHHHQYYPPYPSHYPQDPHQQFYDQAASPTNTTVTPTEPDPASASSEKPKRGRKPKPKSESEETDPSGAKAPKEKKPKVSKEPKEPKAAKEPKEPKPKAIKEPKAPKEPKPPKEPKQKKSKLGHGDGSGATSSGSKSERSILSFFDRSGSAPSSKPNAVLGEHAHQSAPSAALPNKSAFKQSCLSFDVLDPSKAGSYFTAMAADDDRRHGGFMKELPKLTGRAPFEDLMSALLLRSSRLPALNKLDLHHPELDMDMLADVKMVHEFLNTFGTSFGLTEDSGEWVTYDLLLSMIRNPRIDDRLLDLNCKMITAAYEEGQAPKINQFNFPYFLAAGPEAISTLQEKKADKKKKKYTSGSLSTTFRKKPAPLSRLGTIEYSAYTIADRIQALVKALHDITSSPRFHRFMRDEVEENITTLKRQKRKRTEIRKELENQTHELEREMKAIERQAAELETLRQGILASERDTYDGPGEDENGGAKLSRQQRLAQAKDARRTINDILAQQKTLVADLKAKETTWEAKKEELEDISLDDTEIQKDNNVPWTRLRGGYVVNTDEKLRVICLGSDRWGRKYWFWRNFGGVIIEDRSQVGPKLDKEEAKNATLASGDSKEQDLQMESIESTSPNSSDKDTHNATLVAEESMNDVTQRMKTMAQPELAGNKVATTRDRMSIANLLSDASPSEQDPFSEPQQQAWPVEPVPVRDLLDYGPIQTWSLISTTKELASLTRALNGKGNRERVLKASLITMRKDIEASFDRIRTWAGREHTSKNQQTVSVLGAVGQPLTQEELMLLLKKKGRKSKQELADIAATRQELAAAMGTAGDDEESMEVDAHQDLEMADDNSEQQQQLSDQDMEAGFLAAVRENLTSGPKPTEYFESIVQAAEKRLEELSGAICNGDGLALTKAIQKVRSTSQDPQNDQLLAAIKVLNHCLDAMGEPPLAVETAAADETAMDIVQENGVEGIALASPLSVPISVNPRLLAWLRTCHIDTMLQDVKTFGALHAWLDECISAVASVVYETDEDDENEEDSDGIREKDEEDEDANDHIQDEDDDEEEEGEEHDHDDDEEDEAGDDKAQEGDHQDDEDDEEEEQRNGRQNKTRQEPVLKFSNIRGRALRSRSGKPVSYKMDPATVEEEDEEQEEDEDEEEEEQENKDEEMEESDDEDESIASRLRRTRRRH